MRKEECKECKYFESCKMKQAVKKAEKALRHSDYFATDCDVFIHCIKYEKSPTLFTITVGGRKTGLTQFIKENMKEESE